MEEVTRSKSSINWKSPECGGENVHGAPTCHTTEGEQKYPCDCINMPHAFNSRQYSSLAGINRMFSTETDLRRWVKGLQVCHR